MGSSVVSGRATMLVCATGAQTQIGHVAGVIVTDRGETAFEHGVRQFGELILRVTSVLVAFVLIVNLMVAKPLLDSLMFALALAVGLTPELLPMVFTVTLASGALRLSRQHVIVKRLSAIPDIKFGPLQNRPHPALAFAAIAIVGFAAALPLLPLGAYFGLVSVPLWFYGVLGTLLAAYLMMAQIIKAAFYKWYDKEESQRFRLKTD